MLSEHEFYEKLGVLQDEIRALEDCDDPVNIEQTALRLEGFNYAVPVLLPVPDFLRCTQQDLLLAIGRIVKLSDNELPVGTEPAEGGNGWELKLQHISVLVFYFKELVELRCGVPEAWDEVDELYVHD